MRKINFSRPAKASTVSIGVSSLAAEAQTPGGAAEALVAAADKALYEAKHRGRNQVMAG